MKYKDIMKDTCASLCYNVPHILLEVEEEEASDHR